MHTTAGLNSQSILESIADFHAAADVGDLWGRLHKHLAQFGIGEVMYGCKAMLGFDRLTDLFLCSYPDAYLKDKMASGLLEADIYVRHVQSETAAVLWSDESRLRNLPPETRRSLAVDWDHGVVVGASLPIRFNRNRGVGGFGLHAPALTQAEFDDAWLAHGPTIRGICDAFDILIRENHANGFFHLAPREIECLGWLAIGKRPKQIAHRLGTHVKTVEKQIGKLRDKLNANTNCQAVTMALAYGLV